MTAPERPEHSLDDEDGCAVCTPTSIPVEREDGSVGWVIAHQPDPDRVDDAADQADRAATIAEAIEIVRRGEDE